MILLGLGYEAWMICDNEGASKKFVAIEHLVFYFEFFIGVFWEKFLRMCVFSIKI